MKSTQTDRLSLCDVMTVSCLVDLLSSYYEDALYKLLTDVLHSCLNATFHVIFKMRN